MLLWKTIDVADTERVFVYRRERLAKVLEPGRHRIEIVSGAISAQIYDVTGVRFAHANPKFVLKTYAAKLEAYISSIELSDNQLGLLYRDNHLVEVLAPGSFYAYWKGVEDVRVDVIDIAESYQVDESILALIGRGLKVGTSKEVVNAVNYAEIPDEHVGLMFTNGKLEKLLEPGSFGFWKYNRSVVIKLLDLRLQVMEVNGQEILTKDRVSLRVNLNASYRISNPELVALKLKDYANFAYQDLQLRLREAVGTKTLDQLLEDKDSLNAFINAGVREKFKDYGIELIGVGVKDIILPGEMKVILNKVVEAQKEAEANLIKRREETQAMRSLHNTAKMMENNDTLLRLKELESLEKVTERIDKISVYGGLDGVLNDLIKLKPA